jgi:hypothetical protein
MSSGTEVANAAIAAGAGLGTARKNWVPPVLGLALDEDWTRACGQPLRQQSWRQPVPVAWRCIGQLTPISFIARSHERAQGMPEKPVMPHVSPAIAGWAESTATTMTETNWRNFFISLEKSITQFQARSVRHIMNKSAALLCRRQRAHRHQHIVLAHDQGGGVQGGQLEAVAVGDGVGGAGLHAVAAEDAAVVVDVIDLGVAL